MKRVLLGSMPVGGGHNALRDSFLTVLKHQDPRGGAFHPITFNSQDTRVRAFYEYCVHHAPWSQGLVYRFGRARWGVRVLVPLNRGLLEEAKETLVRERPDVVVSTHFLLSMMFARARRELGLNVSIVSAIPDYGEFPLIFCPDAEDVRADYFVAMEQSTYDCLLNEYQVPREQAHLSGFLPRQPFLDVSKAFGSEARFTGEKKRQLFERLKAERPEFAHADPDLPTVIFLGGSAWTEKALPVIERLLENPAFLDRINVVVVCGNNEAFENLLRARAGQNPSFSIFGFVDAKLMAELQSVADVPVLGSLAPASMQELLETRCGPLMLFHYIPGTEDAHVAHIRDQEIGLFEPDPDAMLDLLMQATGYKQAGERMASLLRSFPVRAQAIRNENVTRALKFGKFLARVGRVVPLAPLHVDAPSRDVEAPPRAGAAPGSLISRP
ncbi:MAG: hypothetical protein WBV82_32360 [Myxococcaceae bacterium]